MAKDKYDENGINIYLKKFANYSHEELMQERVEWKNNSHQSIAIDRIVHQQQKAEKIAADKIKAKRHIETLKETRNSNRLSRLAIFIAIFSLIISCLSFTRNAPRETISKRNMQQAESQKLPVISQGHHLDKPALSPPLQKSY